MTVADLSYQAPGTFEETRFEKIHNIVFSNAEQASVNVAREIAALIRQKQAKQQPCVLGLATGSSPIKVYEELVRMHQEEGLSFGNVVSFNLDEYCPMEKNSVHSYHYFMHQHLFDHIDIDPKHIHIPSGTIPQDEIHQYCIDYDLKIKEYGGLDFQLLGIGRTGHIGFNEPGSHFNSGTRIISLDHLTRADAASSFLGIDNVPRRAITMGIGTVKNAGRIVLLAWGGHKAEIVRETIEGPMTSEVPASYLQTHKNTSIVLNEEAAEELTRIKTPWLVGPCIWDDFLISKAVVWLCEHTQKSILKLTDKDYNDHGMSGLLAQEGNSYDLNIRMFNRLQHTITGWPGGKPNADDSSRPERALPKRKKVLIFSPHPDDDVISMGGTLDRLVEQGHEVHIAYQTSGNIAVADHEAMKYVEIIQDLCPDKKGVDSLIKEINSRNKNIEDDLSVRRLKGLIRKREALGASRFLGVPDNNVHFLNLPFYETGTVKKLPIGPEDIDAVSRLIAQVQPHQIYAAGDLADPHGTHKVCLDAVLAALKNLRSRSFMKDCWVWLYRGAWLEWDIHQIDMAVPLSPDQVLKKRKAIFFHQSQKDGVMFQGNDTREFWVRAEERNDETARRYHELGLADYAAMEAFKKYEF
ncbi:MAG: glucosamine-6-phosphate deaminase [Lutibacter sp.]|jgi:glucosamine-6-phosphate deaminase|nr:glucosamine-6-phosphate deaminase [Lutibacter sp.]